MNGDLEALVAAAVAGQSLSDIAAAAGTSVSTAQRRLRDPGVVAMVNQARAEHRQEALGQLTTLRSRALERIRDLLDSADPAIVLRTASLVLATSTRFDLLVDHDQRLAALEANEGMPAGFADVEEVAGDGSGE